MTDDKHGDAQRQELTHSPALDSDAMREALDYIHAVIIENAERAKDIVFDTASQEQNGGILGIKAVAEQAAASLDAIAARVAALAPQPALDPATVEAQEALLAFRHGDPKHLTQEHARILYAKLTDASNACLELASEHGLATGHGDTVADMIREFSAQIPKLPALDTVEAILRQHFYTGEPGDYDAIKAAARALLASPAPSGEPAAWGRMINGKAVTISLQRTDANDEPLYSAPCASKPDSSTNNTSNAEPASRSTAERQRPIAGDDRESMETQPAKASSPEAGSPPPSTDCCKGLAPPSECRCEQERAAQGHSPYPRGIVSQTSQSGGE